jgi:cellulose synthase/poly-beta-1,6-N-acetylglucosamine synthase-like glycosyltransferase
MMPIWAHLLLLLLAVLPGAACAYLALLTLLSARVPRPLPANRRLRFDILVPAHNEAAVIARTIASLRQLDWPRDGYRILVLADNCEDDTADIARAAGATVVERHDDSRRGKGYAVEAGVAHSARGGRADAMVFIDADTTVTPNLLSACAARIEAGAEAMQVHYGVLNPNDSWRTRLVTMAYGASHAVRSRARERMGASCGLRGNGMCLTHALLKRHPFQVYSMTEDLEYGIQLGLHGVRVHYIDEASADAELVPSGGASATQRQRWESGRRMVARAYTGKLLRAAWRRRSGVCLELALDLLTPPLGIIALQIGILLVVAAAAAFAWSQAFLWVGVALAMMLIILMHVLRGWQLSPLGPQALLDLLRVPFFIAWKVAVRLRHRGNRAWIKTRRNSS